MFTIAQLESMTRTQLVAAGCRAWDESLVLFPATWYDKLPNGLRVTTVTDHVVHFEHGKTSKDQRYGMLAYGMVCP